MKKIQKLFVVSLAFLAFSSAHALEITDVQSGYWAGSEIIRAIQNNYIQIVDGNKFNPESAMTRGEFVNSLLRVIRRQDESVVQKTNFKDVHNTTPNERSIKVSEQIAMAFGYPDKTFKPSASINHNETMSMIANITKGDYKAADITQFDDYSKIPLWAKRAYIKNVANGIYVNYPDAMKFNPSKNLTRAEAAVLFDRVAQNLDLVKETYRIGSKTTSSTPYYGKKATFLGDNTLGLVDFASNNKVKIYDTKKVIEAGNILIGTSLTEVSSRNDLMATEYVFTASDDVFSEQGTLLYPKGTEFYARVDKISYSAWRQKPEKSIIVFHKYSLPTGETYDMAGVPFTKKDNVIYTSDTRKIKNIEPLVYSPDESDKQKLIDIAYQVAPLTDFDIAKAKTIYILLTGDVIFPGNDYMKFRKKESRLDQDL